MAAKSEYKITKKRNGRYAVYARGTSKTINGEEKVKILLDKGLIKTGLPKKKKHLQRKRLSKALFCPEGLGLPGTLPINLPKPHPFQVAG